MTVAAAKRALDTAELELVEAVADFEHDPLGYVLFAFPWGVANTDLANVKGPRRWQRKFLEGLGHRLQAQQLTGHEVLQLAAATGHGVGKSALISMVLMWAMSTLEDTRVVVTANTEGQLASKTWPEFQKWHRMAINKHWFRFEATAMYSIDESHKRSWRVDMIPWSETNTEAFAGLHNVGRRILLVFDEASAIADKIWEVAEGALTDSDTEIMWIAFGNPTRNAGRFFDCFNRLRHRWDCLQLDSRTVEGTNKAQLAKWVEDEGEDSDFVRVRIRGVFPRASTMQFINSEELTKSMKRLTVVGSHRNIAIVGVDVARFGPCQSVIATRLGRDARQFPSIKRRGLDGMQLAGLVAEHIKFLKGMGLRVVVFVDGGGVGGPVVDRLHQLGHDNVIEVQFGGDADDKRKYANKRSEMYGRLRDWLPIGALPKDAELTNECAAVQYSFTNSDQIILMKKERMIALGMVSPDTADAYALTFAQVVPDPGPGDPSPSPAGRTTQRTGHDPREALRNV